MFMFDKNYNVVVKRNESILWTTLGDVLADKIEYYKGLPKFHQT